MAVPWWRDRKDLPTPLAEAFLPPQPGQRKAHTAPPRTVKLGPTVLYQALILFLPASGAVFPQTESLCLLSALPGAMHVDPLLVGFTLPCHLQPGRLRAGSPCVEFLTLLGLKSESRVLSHPFWSFPIPLSILPRACRLPFLLPLLPRVLGPSCRAQLCRNGPVHSHRETRAGMGQVGTEGHYSSGLLAW